MGSRVPSPESRVPKRVAWALVISLASAGVVAMALRRPHPDGSLAESDSLPGPGSRGERSSFVPRGHTDVDDEASASDPTSRPPAEATSQVAALRADLDRKLDAELRDDSWSGSAEDGFSRLFREDQQLAGTTLHHVVCRATVCRLTLDHVDGEVQREFGGLLGWLPGLDGRGVLVPGPGYTSIVYAARPGHRVPVDPEILRMPPDAPAGDGA
jgi:hypothetical protein